MGKRICNETIAQIASEYSSGDYDRYYLASCYKVAATTISRYLHFAIEKNLVNDDIALAIKEVAYTHALESFINPNKVKRAFEESFKIRKEYLKGKIPES